ncbi:MAG TPA: MDR family MFS transporter [Candidatus Dormibacteraeota bacterium]|nr:MDR family MFS transporter [Candidatus Dormibacteraeota bacterium]
MSATAAIERVRWTPQLIRVMAGLLLSLFVAALDTTVVGTALPTISRELGSFELYPWIIAGYLITATTTVPIWGRLADIRGRRVVLLVGVLIFIIASALCAISPSMGWLIAFRTLQGIGAGCIQPIVFTVVADIFPLQQRARLQGVFSSVWAIAAVAGPALGALFVSTIGWRWIFTINIPIGIIATGLIWGYSERRAEVADRRIEVWTTGLLTVGVVLLLIGLGTGSRSASPIWPLLPAAAAMLGAFAWLEWRASSPTLPLRLLRNGVIGSAIVTSILAGTVMFGVTSYIPLWVQSVQGGSAYEGGVAVGAMAVGWPVMSGVAGFIMVRVGYQRLVLAGGLALVAGTVLLALAPVGSNVSWTVAATLVMGAGIGTFTAPLLIVMQSSVDWGQRGALTALYQFSRTIGGAVGVAIMGIILQRYLTNARSPLLARMELRAGLDAIFLLMVVTSLAVVATAIGVVLGSRPSATRGASGALSNAVTQGTK